VRLVRGRPEASRLLLLSMKMGEKTSPSQGSLTVKGPTKRAVGGMQAPQTSTVTVSTSKMGNGIRLSGAEDKRRQQMRNEHA